MEINKNVSLKNKNWFKTGGNARYYCEPTNEKEFCESLEFANKNNLQIFILGQGANVLISDNGFDGIVISPKLNQKSILPLNKEYSLVVAESGETIKNLINFCLDNNLVGLEEFSGIPASVGGATFINLHYYDYSLHHFLVKAKIINKNSLKISEVDKEWFKFGYDDSKLQNNENFLLSATFKLKKVTPLENAYSKGRRDETIRHRVKRYPTSHTCGCFFRNFHKDEVSLVINGKKAVWISYYLDKLGIKGELRVGNAIVSSQHSNMIINRGNATSKDIILLAKKMQELIKEKFNLVPKTECQLVGFKKNHF